MLIYKTPQRSTNQAQLVRCQILKVVNLTCYITFDKKKKTHTVYSPETEK